MFSSKFVNKFRRQKSLQKNSDENEKPMEITTRYVGIDNDDLAQRVQHTIRNLLELNEEELAYISEMNSKDMFEIVKLLNKVVSTLVENII